MNINGNEIEFSSETPKEAGVYIWKAELSNSIQLLHIYTRPATEEFGMSFGAYLAVTEMRGRNVDQLHGEFAKIEMD